MGNHREEIWLYKITSDRKQPVVDLKVVEVELEAVDLRMYLQGKSRLRNLLEAEPIFFSTESGELILAM